MSVTLVRLGRLPAALLSLTLLATSPLQAQSPEYFVGGVLGYQSGVAVQLFGLANGFAQGFPLPVRVRLGWATVERGDAAAARRVFINNATNGTPAESGRTLDLGLEVLHTLGPRTVGYAGIRRTSFKANFKFIGGNEDFDVVSSHWGIALGAETSYPMGTRTALMVSGGFELFKSSRLSGHDTSYSPDGDNANPREDYRYSDADAAVAQPRLRPALMVGLRYRLGG